MNSPLAVKAQTAAAMRPDVLRRMVSEWTAAGCIVEIEPDGKIRVTPPAQMPKDAFDLVDMRK